MKTIKEVYGNDVIGFIDVKIKNRIGRYTIRKIGKKLIIKTEYEIRMDVGLKDLCGMLDIPWDGNDEE